MESPTQPAPEAPRICSRCVLPENMPGVRLDEQGVCQYCHEGAHHPESRERREHFRRKFLTLLQEHGKPADSAYDVVVAYSGGKDSTYTLYLLSKVYGLRALAVTMDNGFISPAALDNTRRVLDRLGVDHLLARPSAPFLRELFRASLEQELYPARSLLRASSVCTTCISLVKGLLLKTTMEKGVHFIAYGWSPGQSPLERCLIRLNPMLMSATQAQVRQTLQRVTRHSMAPYFPDMERMGQEAYYEVHPLAFIEYEEHRITETICNFGWRRPEDTDPNSTNCMLNTLGNAEHIRRYGYHPYALEIAGIVRSGGMTREEGLLKLAHNGDDELAAKVRAILFSDGEAKTQSLDAPEGSEA